MQLILDSDSSMLWFPTIKCLSCKGGTARFDTKASLSYNQISKSLQTYKYDAGEVKGYTCEEQVWLTDTIKIDKVPCLAVTEQSDLDDMKVDGVLGLSPLSLLDLMKDSEIIGRRAISFMLRKPGTRSTFAFGELEADIALANSNTATLAMHKEGQVYSVHLQSS